MRGALCSAGRPGMQHARENVAFELEGRRRTWRAKTRRLLLDEKRWACSLVYVCSVTRVFPNGRCWREGNLLV
ncbi:hypothetical protein P154DRAFT_296563 [Amniculicola lignicola CBS 123094]|uniref:Uncharacterized protein n=1 Tax=Amniculicola lignicola CBS 123094 TaxID=1392246 RepID=A0A6A5WHS6_9PLEO|nr:hypothetical protein P154DRAFT_296563 [Amniculicola lignicola CBS 123094]